MKRGKVDEKITEPLFPRLHVNDTEKGGPRAPPRNKMALYEQLTTATHRFNHGAFPPNATENNNLVPASSTSQSSGTGRNLCSSHHVLSSNATSFHVGERLHDGNSNAPFRQIEQRRKVADEEDFMVPVFVHTSMAKPRSRSRERPTGFGPSHLVQSKQMHNIGDTDENNKSGIGTILRQDRENLNEEHLEVCASVRENSVRSSTSSRTARFGNTSVNQQKILPDAKFSRLSKGDICLAQEPTTLLQKNDNWHGENVSEPTKETEKKNNPELIAVSESCSGDYLNSQSKADRVCIGDKSCRSPQFVIGDKSDDISETSAVDSVIEVSITPDDVVGMIGQKHFWKARRAIVNQQRLFALQVFELHKLIKVQQLIAASPHLLLQNNGYPGKPSKASSNKELPSEYVLVPPVHVAKCQNDSDKQNHDKEHAAENGVGKTSFSSVKNVNNNHEPYMTNPTPIPMPIGNQWLVPVMSPSEGLVYKPYTPPGFMDSAWGGYHGNFFNPFYGNIAMPVFPGVIHSYFPPYAVPFIDPSQGHSGGLSGVGANFNMPTKKRGFDSQKASRDSKVLGSTASSPIKKVQAVMAIHASEGKDALLETGQPNRVIKVVPHNRRSATESAARIFQSIQEERKNHEYV